MKRKNFDGTLYTWVSQQKKHSLSENVADVFYTVYRFFLRKLDNKFTVWAEVFFAELPGTSALST